MDSSKRIRIVHDLKCGSRLQNLEEISANAKRWNAGQHESTNAKLNAPCDWIGGLLLSSSRSAKI
jgi:hypothetical protein